MAANSDDANARPMPVLPKDFAPYKRTPLFTQDSVPASLLKDHKTAAHSWGQLNIESGLLKYYITESGHEGEYLLDPNNPGVITSTHSHYIKPVGNVSFYIEFFRRPS